MAWRLRFGLSDCQQFTTMQVVLDYFLVPSIPNSTSCVERYFLFYLPNAVFLVH